MEDCPSLDKAVMFLEVPHLRDAVEVIGEHRIISLQPAAEGRAAWAILHAPEGHNILLLEPARHAHS